MSLLNPVLLPPKVKAYLSQGERFIKWDDVSGAGRGCGLLGRWDDTGPSCYRLCLGEWFGLSTRTRCLCSLARQLTTALINKPGGEGMCPKHMSPGLLGLGLCVWI